MVKSRSLVAKILETIGGGVVTTFDIITAILESGYGASYSKMSRNLRKIESERWRRKLELEERARFYRAVSRLKSGGLITRSKKGWKITKLGREKFFKILAVKNRKVNKSPFQYKKGESKRYNLVVFDIPEKDRAKRDWLREVLVFLGFKMLQKSVWIGKVSIPPEFIKDLDELKIFRFVHIFAVMKTGTIEIEEEN